MEISDIRRELGLENLDPKDIDKIKFQLQTLNDTIQGGLRSANLVEYRNTYVINAQDSLDANFPMYVHFNIISEMTKIISIKLSFWLLPFRSYSKAGAAQGTPSGGGSTSGSGGGQTSSSGGGQTTSSVGTPSGGGATSGATGSASGGGATSGGQGSASGGGATSGSGGGQTSSYVTTPSGGSSVPTSSYQATPSGGGKTSAAASGTQYHVLLGDDNYIVAHEGGYYLSSYPGYITTVKNSHTHTVADHTHPTHAHQVAIPNHTHPIHAHTVANHQHTTPNHTHPNHYHSTPAHTHPNHTHSTPNHTHPNHTHTVANHTHTVANHTHSTPAHTHPNHTHSAVYGIFEEETSATIMVYISRDNGLTYSLPVGSYTNDQETLDITRFIDTKGSKMIKFTSNTRARLSVQIEIKLDIKAR